MTGPPVALSPLPVGGAALLSFYGAEKGDFLPPANAGSPCVCWPRA